MKQPLSIAFLHPDLGIGGAERAIVDAAMALQQYGGHCVTIFTNYHNPAHCFEETLPPASGGALKVVTVAQWLPKTMFGGRFKAALAYLKMLLAALWIIVFERSSKFDAVFIDQVSVPIPLFKLLSSYKIAFYCHFPDQLLATNRNSLRQRGVGVRRLAAALYRSTLDWLEEFSLAYADKIFVNSKFTDSVFEKTFSSLADSQRTVLYPIPNFANLSSHSGGDDDDVAPLLRDLLSESLHHKLFGHNNKAGKITLFLSINRYERKKNIELAIHAMSDLIGRLKAHTHEHTHALPHLIHVGGFDTSLAENAAVFESLSALIGSLRLEAHVTLLTSCSNAEKVALLRRAACLVYTPVDEHFGIVPIEAMFLRTPVLAVDSGGPTETVADGQTGFLRASIASEFADVMQSYFCESSGDDDDANTEQQREQRKETRNRRLIKMGENAHRRVRQLFSFETFSRKLCEAMEAL